MVSLMRLPMPNKNMTEIQLIARPKGIQMVSTLILKGEKPYFKGESKIQKYPKSNCFNSNDTFYQFLSRSTDAG